MRGCRQRDAAEDSDMRFAIAIHCDVSCPWGWIGRRRLERALAAFPGATATVTWHPVRLDPAVPATGAPRAGYRAQRFGGAQRAQALDARVTRLAAEVGLVFDLPAQARQPNTLAAHRLVWWAGRQGRQDALVEALFGAHFRSGLDIGDPAVLARLAAGVGCDARAAESFLAGREGIDELLAAERAIRQEVACGAPLFVIDGRQRVSGAQSVALFSTALLQATEAAAGGAASHPPQGLCST